MKDKPGLLFAISALALILLAVSFGVQLKPVDPVHLKEGINHLDVLYVCPLSTTSYWATLSHALQPFKRVIAMGFFFACVVLFFCWGWALYQNLLKDKFSSDVYKNPWTLTKIVFWFFVIVRLAIYTPDHFKQVNIHVHNQNTDWVHSYYGCYHTA